MREDRSRRAFLRLEAPAQADECHISSLLVHVRPERQQEIAALIADLPGAELAPSPKPGKLILTLETANTSRSWIAWKRSQHAGRRPPRWSTTNGKQQAESEPDHGSHPPELPQS